MYHDDGLWQLWEPTAVTLTEPLTLSLQSPVTHPGVYLQTQAPSVTNTERHLNTSENKAGTVKA
jgi:hypothetical protein